MAVAVSEDVPDVRGMPGARDTHDAGKHDDKRGGKGDDKKSDGDNDEDDGSDDNVWSPVDDVVGPEYRRQITNKGKWK